MVQDLLLMPFKIAIRGQNRRQKIHQEYTSALDTLGNEITRAFDEDSHRMCVSDLLPLQCHVEYVIDYSVARSLTKQKPKNSMRFSRGWLLLNRTLQQALCGWTMRTALHTKDFKSPFMVESELPRTKILLRKARRQLRDG